jgi:hypothetical protein
MKISRFKFTTVEGYYLKHESDIIRFDHQATLHPVGSPKISETRKFEVIINNINTEREAIELGIKYKNALKLAFADLLIGADFGMNIKRMSGSSKFIDFVESYVGLFSYDDNNDILIYDENNKPDLIRIDISGGGVGVPCDKLDEKVKKYLEYNKLDLKKEIAYDLLSTSFILPTVYSELIVLIMAIEFMSKPVELDKNEIDYIESLQDISMNGEFIDEERKRYYYNLIGYWKSGSIRKQCISLVEEIPNREIYGSTNRKFFDKVYSMRSDLVHGASNSMNKEKYNEIIYPLQIMVRDLICRK